MQQFVKWVLGMLVILLWGGSIFAYTLTERDIALLDVILPMIDEVSDEGLESLDDFLTATKKRYEDGSKKHALAHQILKYVERVQKQRMVEDSFPTISDEILWQLMNHLPESVSEKDILLVEFTDLECPFCKRFHDEGTLQDIVETHQETGMVSLAFPLKFHPHAREAADTLQCLWQTQGYASAVQFKSDLFEAWFSSTNDIIWVLWNGNYENIDAVTACKISGDADAAVDQQIAIGKALWVSGTPSTVIIHASTWRWVKMSGAQSFSNFDLIVSDMKDDNRVNMYDAFYNTEPAAQRPVASDETRYKDFLETVYISWNPDAEITIIEFSDVQCPFCQKHTNNKTLDTVYEKHGDKVNLVFAHFPLWFHKNAQQAGEALECAGKIWGESMFFEFKKAYFALGGDASLDIAKMAAEEVGLDEEALMDCVLSGEFEQLVKDHMLFGRTLWVTWTPGNVIIHNPSGNYLKLNGAVPAERFDAPIEQLLDQ